MTPCYIMQKTNHRLKSLSLIYFLLNEADKELTHYLAVYALKNQESFLFPESSQESLSRLEYFFQEKYIF